MKYSPKEIIMLAASLGENKKAKKWLHENRIELSALSDAFINNSKKPLDWLESHRFLPLVAFYYAFIGNNEAFNYLVRSKRYEFAAVVGITRNDQKAFQWILKYRMKHYAHLAKALISIDERNRELGLVGYGGSIGGAGAGGGFGGFGGGGFGGGGAGGSW